MFPFGLDDSILCRESLYRFTCHSCWDGSISSFYDLNLVKTSNFKLGAPVCSLLVDFCSSGLYILEFASSIINACLGCIHYRRSCLFFFQVTYSQASPLLLCTKFEVNHVSIICSVYICIYKCMYTNIIKYLVCVCIYSVVFFGRLLYWIQSKTHPKAACWDWNKHSWHSTYPSQNVCFFLQVD